MKLRNEEDTFVTVKGNGEDIQEDMSVDDLLLMTLIYLGTYSNP
jgi:hypothetical protein